MNRNRFVVGLALVLVASVSSSTLEAQEWWRFRGPNGAGVSAAANLPVELDPAAGALWSRELPAGRSSPILVGDRLYLTGIEADTLVTLALSAATGEEVWRAELPRPRVDEIYSAGDTAAATPVSDGDNLYVFFTELGLVSFDRDGTERWRMELGPFDNFYGIGASPILAGDVVLMILDQVQGSLLLAIDTATGEERWRAQRPGRIESWTTPTLYPVEGQSLQVLVYGSGWVDAYDLATGEPTWALPGLGGGPVASPVVVGSRLVVATPEPGDPLPSYASIAAGADADGDGSLNRAELDTVEGFGEHFDWFDRDDDALISPAEYGELAELIATSPGGLMAIDLPAIGSRDMPSIAWSVEQSVAYISTPTVYDGVVYMVRDGGILSSVDLATGEVIKRARTSRSAGEVYASPVVADGKLFVASLGGELAVLSAVGDWEVLAINEFDEPIYATPVPAPGRLYVRTAGHLYAFGTGTGTEVDG